MPWFLWLMKAILNECAVTWHSREAQGLPEEILLVCVRQGVCNLHQYGFFLALPLTFSDFHLLIGCSFVSCWFEADFKIRTQKRCIHKCEIQKEQMRWGVGWIFIYINEPIRLSLIISSLQSLEVSQFRNPMILQAGSCLVADLLMKFDGAEASISLPVRFAQDFVALSVTLKTHFIVR